MFGGFGTNETSTPLFSATDMQMPLFQTSKIAQQPETEKQNTYKAQASEDSKRSKEPDLVKHS